VEARLKALDNQIEGVSHEERFAPVVGRLRAFRGIDTLTAMTLIAELHDFMRFESPRGLMAFLGLVPSEHSSGGKRSRGPITKAGNGHVRRLMIEAAWQRAVDIGERPELPDSVHGRGSFLAAHNLAVLYAGLRRPDDACLWRAREQAMRAAAA